MSTLSKPAEARATKWFYAFGNGTAEGDGARKDLLGGKGAGLADMTRAGIPVPPGFTITTEACRYYYAHGQELPDGFEDGQRAVLAALEESIGKKLGDPQDPLLVSVRSGAMISMPGMMDTILNLGLNDRAVTGLALRTENPRFAWDCYRRFLQMFGCVVLDIDKNEFERPLEALRKKRRAKTDADLGPDDLKSLVAAFKKTIRPNMLMNRR